jgi:hypothetical protein
VRSVIFARTHAQMVRALQCAHVGPALPDDIETLKRWIIGRDE